jgi:hypothetical protein
VVENEEPNENEDVRDKSENEDVVANDALIAKEDDTA